MFFLVVNVYLLRVVILWMKTGLIHIMMNILSTTPIPNFIKQTRFQLFACIYKCLSIAENSVDPDQLASGEAS